MGSCKYCANTKIAYHCGKCGSDFCSEHVISTESFICKKHPHIVFNKQQAETNNKDCPVFDKSKCPKCGALLYLDKMPDNRYYLKCTKCAWNSYMFIPAIYYTDKRSVIREAVKQKLLKKGEMCGSKLKKNKGINVCPSCLVEFLKNGNITSFETIENMFNLGNQIVKILNNLVEQKRISGFVDTRNLMFIYLSEEAKDQIMRDIFEVGTVTIKNIANRFNFSEENAIDLILKIISENKVFGTFDLTREKYYTKEYLDKWFIEKVTQAGRISIQQMADHLNLEFDKVKTYLIDLLKTRKIEGYFADAGKQVVTIEKLEDELMAFAKEHGVFKLTEAAQFYNITPELVRRTLFNLIQQKKIRGLFTQKREFITEQELLEKIKGIAKVYKTIKLRDLANKIGITTVKVVEILEHLISHGSIYGYIDNARQEFVSEAHQPMTIRPAPGQSTLEEKNNKIEVLREYDFVGGQVRFKVVVKNHSDMAIHDIKVILDVPTSYNRKTDIINIPVIDPKNSRGVDFYLEPQECGISTIGGTVIYKDARGQPHTIHIRPKEVQIKCPLVVKTLDRIEDCQLAIQNLPSDARAFLIADLDPQLAFRAAFRAITNFATRNVTSLEIPDKNGNGYKAEAWFSSEAKVTGGRIITRVEVNGANQSLEIRVWCADPGQLTGFLAKIIELLFLEINLVRKVKAEARQRTIDVMSITQNLITASDLCAVRYEAKDILLKLEDTHERMLRVLGPNDPTLSRIDYWIEKLQSYEEGQKINDDDAESLMTDIESFQNTLARAITPM
ncbi:MAG: PCI domain-containing protein [Promethearchaeota archaeon]